MTNQHAVTLPSNDEIMQDETYPMVTIPVCVEGPVRVQQLPSKGGGAVFVMNVPASTGAAVKVLNHDPMRRRAAVLAYDVDVYVSTSQAGCTPAQAAPWPIARELEWTSVNELWMLSTGNATRVTIVSERWAD